MANRRAAFRLAGRLGAAGIVGGLAARGAWLGLGHTASASTALLDRNLRVGYLPVTDAAALLTAHHRGIWASAGVPSSQPVLFRSWDALAQAFVIGELDVVHLLMPLALQLRLAHDAPIRVIGWGHTNGSALVVAKSISDTAQLAGGTVAVPYWWSVHSILLQRLLAAAGLRPVIGRRASSDEVQLVVVPPAEMVAALASGQVSGFTVADPFGAVAELKGVGRVHRLLGDVWRDHACCAVAVRQDLIQSHPAAVQAIVDGLVTAQTWLDANRQDGALTLSTGGYLPQPVAAIQRSLARPGDPTSKHADWHGERLGFSAFPHASYTERLVTLMADTAIDGDRSFLTGIDPTSVHGRLVDDRFVRQTLAHAGSPIPARIEEVSP